MPSQKPNIIENLRAKHEPHQKLAGRVLGLEKRVSRLEGAGTNPKALLEGAGTKPKALLPPASDTKKIGADSFKKGTALDSAYASRVYGKDATGEYLSPEERKARFKKTKITGADIKKGSSVDKAAEIAKEQAAMQQAAIDKAKIDLATKYEGSSADSVKPADAEAEKEKGGPLAKGTESLIGPLKTIDSGVNGIIETLKASNKADTKEQSNARKRAEKEKRSQKEGKLEGIKGKLAGAVDTVLAPVKSIFQKIWDFLKTVLLGRVVLKLFEWFADPSNTEKVSSLFRFLKDWWPVLVAGIMAVVGPGMIFTAGLIALLVWGVPKIIEAVKWVGSLFGIGVDKELKTIEKESAKTGDDLVDTMDKDLTADTEDTLSKNKGEVSETGESPDVDKTPAQVSETQQQATDVQTGADQAEPLKMAGGGRVPGSGSGDTVPAMLTPGEFVMSKGAVQQYGANTLAGMNAAAGGTNRPRMGRYKGGGEVASGGPRIHYNGGGIVNMNRFGSDISLPRIPVQYFKGGGKVEGLPGLSGGGGGLNSLTEQAKVKTWGSAIGDFFSGDDGRSRIRGIDDKTAKIVKSTLSQIPINPPSRLSPEVIIEDPVGDANTKVDARTAPGQELPEFSATQMRSLSKIKTLGIVA